MQLLEQNSQCRRRDDTYGIEVANIGDIDYDGLDRELQSHQRHSHEREHYPI